jgi:hypothetical protein
METGFGMPFLGQLVTDTQTKDFVRVHPISSHSKHPGPFLVTALAAAVLLRLGMGIALPLLTFGVGLAVVGPSKWAKWTGAFLLVAAISGVVLAAATAILPKDGVWVGLVLFSLVPLLPALFLWVAVLIRGRTEEIRHG